MRRASRGGRAVRARRTRPGALGPALALAAILVAGCSSTPAPAPVAGDPRLRAQALIDSGNAAYRAGDYAGAAKRFASAVVVSPEDPAAFYGLGMSLAKLGRDDEARAAYARSRELSRGETSDDEMPREVRYRRTVHP